MPTNWTLGRPNQLATTVERPKHSKNQSCQLTRQEKRAERSKKSAGIYNKEAINSYSNNKKNNNNNIYKGSDRRPKTVFPRCEKCGERNHSAHKCYFGANAAKIPPARNKRMAGQSRFQQCDIQNNESERILAGAQR